MVLESYCQQNRFRPLVNESLELLAFRKKKLPSCSIIAHCGHLKVAQFPGIKKILRLMLSHILCIQKCMHDARVISELVQWHFLSAVREFSAGKKLPPKATLSDNCSAHYMNDELKVMMITVHFLPSNVNAMIQFMDQKVIQNWKMRYVPWKLLFHAIAHDRANAMDQFLKQLKGFCFWIFLHWTVLQSIVIKHSCKKIGLILGNKLVHADGVPLPQMLNTKYLEKTSHYIVER